MAERAKLEARLLSLDLILMNLNLRSLGNKKLRSKVHKLCQQNIEVKADVKDEETEESEDSALEYAFRNSIVERLHRLENNIEVIMTGFNKLVERVKGLEEQRIVVSLNEEQITWIKNKVVELKLKDALEEFKKAELKRRNWCW